MPPTSHVLTGHILTSSVWGSILAFCVSWQQKDSLVSLLKDIQAHVTSDLNLNSERKYSKYVEIDQLIFVCVFL